MMEFWQVAMDTPADLRSHMQKLILYLPWVAVLLLILSVAYIHEWLEKRSLKKYKEEQFLREVFSTTLKKRGGDN